MYNLHCNYQISRLKETLIKASFSPVIFFFFLVRRGKCSKQLPGPVTSRFNQSSTLATFTGISLQSPSISWDLPVPKEPGKIDLYPYSMDLENFKVLSQIFPNPQKFLNVSSGPLLSFYVSFQIFIWAEVVSRPPRLPCACGTAGSMGSFRVCCALSSRQDCAGPSWWVSWSCFTNKGTEAGTGSEPARCARKRTGFCVGILTLPLPGFVIFSNFLHFSEPLHVSGK